MSPRDNFTECPKICRKSVLHLLKYKFGTLSIPGSLPFGNKQGQTVPKTATERQRETQRAGVEGRNESKKMFTFKIGRRQ